MYFIFGNFITVRIFLELRSVFKAFSSHDSFMIMIVIDGVVFFVSSGVVASEFDMAMLVNV